jgi:hypothetical protein
MANDFMSLHAEHFETEQDQIAAIDGKIVALDRALANAYAEGLKAGIDGKALKQAVSNRVLASGSGGPVLAYAVTLGAGGGRPPAAGIDDGRGEARDPGPVGRPGPRRELRPAARPDRGVREVRTLARRRAGTSASGHPQWAPRDSNPARRIKRTRALALC